MRSLFAILGALAFAPSVFAASPVEVTPELDLVVVVSAIAGDTGPGAPADAPFLGEVSAGAKAETLLENGVEIGLRGVFRVQADNESRAGFTGRIASCPASLADCPSLGGAAPRGAFSRLTLGEPDRDVGPRGDLALGYVYADGGLGELVVGRDAGIAARFFEGGPSLNGHARGRDVLLDPSGLRTVRVRNDLSGNAAKISYASPRILGARVGISVTPDASHRGLDLDTDRRSPGILEPDVETVIEGGVQVSRLLRDADLRVRGSLTYSHAEIAGSVYDDAGTVSAGVEIARDDEFSFGLAVLNSENGGRGEYSALHASASRQLGNWEIALGGGFSQDETLDMEGETIELAAGRTLSEGLSLVVAGWYDEVETPAGTVSGVKTVMQSRNGLSIELRFRR